MVSMVKKPERASWRDGEEIEDGELQTSKESTEQPS